MLLQRQTHSVLSLCPSKPCFRAVVWCAVSCSDVPACLPAWPVCLLCQCVSMCLARLSIQFIYPTHPLGVHGCCCQWWSQRRQWPQEAPG